jgi:hypothetical protein
MVRGKQCEENVVYPLAQTVWEQARDTARRTLDTISAIVDSMSALPGTRVVLLASSGFMANSLEQDQQELANRAIRAHVVINALDAKGLDTTDLFESSPGAGPTI